MSKGWTIAFAVWGAVMAMLAFMATVPAQQGVSNLRSWADLFGLVALAHALNGPVADRIARWLSYVNLGLFALRYAILAYEHPEAAKKFFFPYGWPFKGD